MPLMHGKLKAHVKWRWNTTSIESLQAKYPSKDAETQAKAKRRNF